MKTILFLFLSLLLSCNSDSGNDSSNPSGTTTNDNTSTDQTSCINALSFTSEVVQPSYINYIQPLGATNPSGGHIYPTQHMYFYLDSSAGDATIYAPTALTLTSVGSSTVIPTNFTDYRLSLNTCEGEVSLYFLHITSLDSSIQNVIDGLSTDSCYEYDPNGGDTPTHRICEYSSLDISLSAGDPIGTMISGMTFDFYVGTSAVSNSYITPELYLTERIQATCPLNFFTNSIKTSYETFLNSTSSSNKCGSVDQDITNRVQGIWHNDKTSIHESKSISFIRFEENSSIVQIAIGPNAISGVPKGEFRYIPGSTERVNTDIANISADGQIYCLSDTTPPFKMYVELKDNTTLWVEYFDTSDPSFSTDCGDPNSFSFSSSQVVLKR